MDPLSPHFISGEAFFDVLVNAPKHVKTKPVSQVHLNVCSRKTQVATKIRAFPLPRPGTLP